MNTQSPVGSLQANDPCWCGSGRKYKRCHRNTEGRVHPGEISPMRTVPDTIPRPSYADTGVVEHWDEPLVKSPEIIDRMRYSGKIAAEVLRLAGEFLEPGKTTDEVDAYVHDLFIERGAYPSTLNYHGYPKSLCSSANEVICHGIPDSRVMRDGDIMNLDVTGFVGGVHGDTNATFCVGEVDEASRDLIRVTEECTWLGIEAVKKKVQEFPQQPEPAYKPFLVRFMYKNGPTIVARHLPHLEGHTDDLRIMSRMLGDDIPGPEPGYNNQVRTEMWDDIDNPLYQKLWKQTD